MDIIMQDRKINLDKSLSHIRMTFDWTFGLTDQKPWYLWTFLSWKQGVYV